MKAAPVVSPVSEIEWFPVYFGTHPVPEMMPFSLSPSLSPSGDASSCAASSVVGGCTEEIVDSDDVDASWETASPASPASPKAAAVTERDACVFDPDTGSWLNAGIQALLRALHGRPDLVDAAVDAARACAAFTRDPADACRAAMNRMLRDVLIAHGHVEVRRRAKKHATAWVVLQAHIQSPDQPWCCYALRVYLTPGAVDLTIHSANSPHHVGPYVMPPIRMRVYDPRRAELLEVGVTTMIATGSLLDLAIAIGIAEAHSWLNRFYVVRHTLACASSIDLLTSEAKVDTLTLSLDKVASSRACHACRACEAHAARGRRAAAAAAAAADAASE